MSFAREAHAGLPAAKGRLALEGDEAGIAMWKKVAGRYTELVHQVLPPVRS